MKESIKKYLTDQKINVSLLSEEQKQQIRNLQHQESKLKYLFVNEDPDYDSEKQLYESAFSSFKQSVSEKEPVEKESSVIGSVIAAIGIVALGFLFIAAGSPPPSEKK